jgi:hypothetical protein
MASVVVDKVITEYILNADRYKSGADQVLSASKKLVAGAGKIGDTLGKGVNAVKGLAIGATIASLPMIGLAKTALDSAVAYDTLQRSLNAITGSAQRTGQILSFVQKLALPSIYTQAQLGEASKTLEAFGLSTERFLPIAEKLGTVFGGTTESLDSFITSLGYLKSGRFGEAFESLARGGISRQQLMGEGLKFDKGGSYLGTVDQALTAVEKLVNQKFGQLSKEMADGAGAGLASFADAWNIAMIKIGGVLLKYVVPVVKQFADALNNLSSSGVLENITNGLMKMFDTKTLGDALIATFAGMLAGLEVMPKFVADVANKFVVAFSNIKIAISVVGGVLAGIFLTSPIVKGVVTLIEAFTTLRKAMVGVSVTGVIMKAILTMGTSIAQELLTTLPAIAVAVTAGFGINYALDKMTEGMSKIGDLPSIEDFTRRQAEIEKMMRGGGGVASTAPAVAGAGGTSTVDTYKALNEAQTQANIRVNASEREVARQRRLYNQAFANAKLYPDNTEFQTQLEQAQKLLLNAQKDLSNAKQQRDLADKNIREYKPITAGAGGALADAGQADQGGFKDSLMKIAESSRETADNTKKQLDLNNRVLGGGSLASRGLSRQEMADMAGGRRSGTKEIKSILVELGYAIERNMGRQTATAFGNQVSRREI